ncbi:MAG TPA: trigger factor [Gemmatimonadaceae bacterium]|nr:trigger factor [Gemmatimonadaceae bacterium]
MDIQITTKKSDGVERLLEVQVPVEAVRDAEDRTARRYASSVRLPGFRPGKAPPQLIKRRFKDAIRQQVIETLVQEAFQEVMDREKLKVASQPHVHDLKFTEGEPLTFELHLEVRPDVELARTQGFRVVRPATQVTDEQVREQIEQIREQQATWTPVQEKPLPGDMVTMQLATAEENGSMPQGKEYRIVLGSGQAIPGIEELAMELRPGETAERDVRWPDDFPDESQRGKGKPVRVTLEDVKRKSLPALDDDFARAVGDFESLAALTASVRTDLEEHARRDAEAGVRQQLLDEIASANPFAVPPSWVNQLIDGYIQMYQVPEEDRERFSAEFLPIAQRQVRRDLIIDAIAEREGLAATESDVDDRVAELAAKRKSEPGQVYATLQKAGRLKEIEHGITEDKVFRWLVERNEVAANA